MHKSANSSRYCLANYPHTIQQHISQSSQTLRKPTNKGNNKELSKDYHMDHDDDAHGDDDDDDDPSSNLCLLLGLQNQILWCSL
ncbi:hypothetical protein L1987_42629 [Smallanthus sonchifolius]|uniref:Uncharacterized protein n=1 Tax=Smallanthus sonchifolius TaxID=185202 RepID=A0ACB9GKJ0_9ASTR|nr:hypothetical protein L1987_42629 [Smallanthus sonchifolius]